MYLFPGTEYVPGRGGQWFANRAPSGFRFQPLTPAGMNRVDFLTMVSVVVADFCMVNLGTFRYLTRREDFLFFVWGGVYFLGGRVR